MAKAKPLPPIDVLREHFQYDAKTGVVTRLCQCGQRGRTGPLTRLNSGGYLVVRFQGPCLLVHRLAWKLMTGEEPPVLLDHINRVRTDNRWVNLRSATPQESMANRTMAKTGAGLRGSSKRPDGRWQAKGRANNTTVYLGTFATTEEAHRAYVRWSLENHKEFSIYAAGPSSSRLPAGR